jgi:NADH-quinone oxidoreductase subunit H
MKFGVFYLAEFANVVLAGALFTVLFLDGWNGAVLPAHLWFLIKIFGFLFVASWVRASIPRLRLDQILGFAWKFLFPLSLLNVMVLAIEVVAFSNPSKGDALTGSELLVMAAINWPIAIVAVVIMSKIVTLGTPAPRLTLVGSAGAVDMERI